MNLAVKVHECSVSKYQVLLLVGDMLADNFSFWNTMYIFALRMTPLVLYRSEVVTTKTTNIATVLPVLYYNFTKIQSRVNTSLKWSLNFGLKQQPSDFSFFSV